MSSSQDVKNTPAQESNVGWVFLSLTRIAIGFVFLWAFIDKAFGLGYSTCAGKGVMCDAAWFAGGKPTQGYLKSSAGEFGDEPTGVYGEMFKGWGDWSLGGFRPLDYLFMLGLLGVGLALILGVGTRIAAFSATALLLMMFIAKFDNTTNPVVDYHIVYSLATFGVVWTEFRKQKIGLGNWYRKLPIVQKYPTWLV